MADFMPRQIAQIQDYSARAGEKLVDILGKQVPSSDIVLDLLNKATRAYDSDQLAKAAAMQESMRALGYGPDKIRGALAGAGFRAGIVGSKELQDRYEEANQAQIAKSVQDEALRKTRLEEEAKNLYGEFLLHQNLAPGAASVYLNQHLAKIRANPYAMGLLAPEISKVDLSVPGTLLTKENVLTVPGEKNAYSGAESKPKQLLTQDLIDSSNVGQAVLNDLKAQGIPETLDAKESIFNTNIEAFIKQIQEQESEKNQGYWGKGDPEDIRKHIMDFYEKAKGIDPTIPETLIIAAARRFLKSSNFTKDVDVDDAKGLQFIRDNVSTWNDKINLYNNISREKQIIDKAIAEKSLDNAYTAFNTNISNIGTSNAFMPHMSDLAKRIAESKQVTGLNTQITPIRDSYLRILRDAAKVNDMNTNKKKNNSN